MNRPPLRASQEPEPVNPLELVLDPGPMGQLYVDVRQSEENPEGYSDGMPLACAEPLRPYQDIVADYARLRDGADFDPLRYWNDNFATPTRNLEDYRAPEGMTIEAYTLAMRSLLTREGSKERKGPLKLLHDHPVPGQRFEHFFYWDSDVVAKSYAADGEWDRVLNVVDNMADQINTIGYVPNFNHGVGVSRSQPPMFPRAVRMVAEEYGPEALVHYLGPLEKEYNYWMSGHDELEARARIDPGRVHGHRSLIRMPDGTYLNRYWDDAEGPRVESYKEDIELAEKVAHGLTGEDRTRRIAQLYKDLRAGCTSGMDFCSRWFADGQNLATIHTTEILPVDLNSLLACTEETLALAHTAAGNEKEAYEYWQRFHDRVMAINKYHWDAKDGIYRDFDFVKGQHTEVVSAAASYPFYAGISDLDQTLSVVDWYIRNDFLTPGGISTTDRETDAQWDGRKKIWLPPNWATARGAVRAGYKVGGPEGQHLIDFGAEVRDAYLSAKAREFATQRVIFEKHVGDDPTRITEGGEYRNQVLGMSIEGRNAMEKWNPHDPGGRLPIGLGYLVLEHS